jgi:hypothetical protein
VSMAGSFTFGLLYHFLLPGPDNVFAQPSGPWGTAFVATAVLLSFLQAAGVLVGLMVARRARQAKSSVAGDASREGFVVARRPRFESLSERKEDPE